MVESDIFLAIELLATDTSNLHPFNHLIRGIQSIITTQNKISGKHILREANRLADRLAKG